MFNYKGATNLVGLLNALKIVGMVMTILLGVSGVASGLVQYLSTPSGESAGPVWILTVIVSVIAATFWTAVVYAVFGFLQHHLAAVSHTAFLTNQQVNGNPPVGRK